MILMEGALSTCACLARRRQVAHARPSPLEGVRDHLLFILIGDLSPDTLDNPG